MAQQLRTDGDSLKAKEYDEKVINLMSDATQIDPDNPTVAHDAGLTLYRAERYEMAIPQFERAVKLDPTDNESLKLLSRCYFMMKDLEKAAEVSRKVIENDPEDYIAIRNLGIILGQLGRSEEAMEMIKKADEIKAMKLEREKSQQNP
jgi:tetratricopeptide (TPR) repeat protein